MCTCCSKCDKTYAANRLACPNCGTRNPCPITPRAKVKAAPAPDTLAADKTLAVFSLVAFAAWFWLDAFLTVGFRTGAF